MTSDDKLIIANINGTDQIVTLDVSDNQVSCLSSVNFGNNPYDVVLHSDSHLYVVTQNDDRVYQADSDGSNATVIWDTDLTIIRDPTAIVELPNGNLLVASSFTDSIEQIQTDGTRVGTSPFIMDSFSVNVQDMIIVYGEAP
jgi:hypothetical protein